MRPRGPRDCRKTPACISSSVPNVDDADGWRCSSASRHGSAAEARRWRRELGKDLSRLGEKPVPKVPTPGMRCACGAKNDPHFLEPCLLSVEARVEHAKVEREPADEEPLLP